MSHKLHASGAWFSLAGLPSCCVCAVQDGVWTPFCAQQCWAQKMPHSPSLDRLVGSSGPGQACRQPADDLSAASPVSAPTCSAGAGQVVSHVLSAGTSCFMHDLLFCAHLSPVPMSPSKVYLLPHCSAVVHLNDLTLRSAVSPHMTPHVYWVPLKESSVDNSLGCTTPTEDLCMSRVRVLRRCLALNKDINQASATRRLRPG